MRTPNNFSCMNNHKTICQPQTWHLELDYQTLKKLICMIQTNVYYNHTANSNIYKIFLVGPVTQLSRLTVTTKYNYQHCHIQSLIDNNNNSHLQQLWMSAQDVKLYICVRTIMMEFSHVPSRHGILQQNLETSMTHLSMRPT